jgi:hypothetical protein
MKQITVGCAQYQLLLKSLKSHERVMDDKLTLEGVTHLKLDNTIYILDSDIK